MSDERKIVGYDMMTGEPIYEEAAQEAAAEQPAVEAVAEPVAEAVVEQPVVEQPTQGEFLGYDPMTGQPIYGQQQQQPTGFDPMTGQPIYGNVPTAAPAKPAKKKGKAPVIILAVLAGVVALALLIVVGVKSGLFLSKGNKVAVATANTFAETPQLVKDLKPILAVTTGTFSLTGNFEMDEIAVEGTVSLDKTEASAFGSLNIEDIPEIDFAAQVNSDGIKAQSKAISDMTFVYKTADDKEDSFLAEMAGEETLEMLDDALAALEETAEPDAFIKDMTALVVAEYGELEFEDAKEKEFEINEKDVKCKGYTVEITEDNIMNIIDGMEDLIDETYGDALKEAGVSAKQLTRELEYEIEGMEDVELTFYLYKNKLAAIIVEVEGEKVEIEFQGGDYRMQNVVVSADRMDIMEIKGETDGSVETVELIVWDEEVFAYEYDTKSGDLVVEAYDGDLEIEANIDAKSDSVTVTLQDVFGTSYVTSMLSGYSDSDTENLNVTCSLTFSDKAKKASFSGSEFNVGTADEDDFYDLVEDLEDTLEDFEELYYYF